MIIKRNLPFALLVSLVSTLTMTSCQEEGGLKPFISMEDTYTCNCTSYEHWFDPVDGTWTHTYDTSETVVTLTVVDSNTVAFDTLFSFDYTCLDVMSDTVYCKFLTSSMLYNHEIYLYPNEDRFYYREHNVSPVGPDSWGKDCFCFQQ